MRSTIFALAIFLTFNAASRSAEAATADLDVGLQADLDLTRLYGDFNAGAYSVQARFKSTVVDEIDNINVLEGGHWDDGIQICTLSVQVVVGEVERIVTKTDSSTPWSWKEKVPMILSYGFTKEGTDCMAHASDLIGTMNAAILVGRLEPVLLPVAAPAPYSSVRAYFEVQRGGSAITVSAEKGSREGTIKLKSLKSSVEQALQKIKSNGLVVNYYVTANSASTMLSLGVGEYRFR